jgi:chaperone required for assembly of F1-ATPase
MKRFYTGAAIVDGALALDGRPVKTKGGNPLAWPAPALMEAVAAEWNAAAERIDFAAMPMTRFAMTLVDLGETDAQKWRDRLLSFLKSDLVCYRASAPASLRARQAAALDPLVDWMRATFGIALATVEGVTFVEQSATALTAGEDVIAALPRGRLLGAKAAAEIAGSAVIGLALAKDAFDGERLFAASRIDEEFQVEQWGVDAEAKARAETLHRDFAHAARFLSLVGDAS